MATTPPAGWYPDPDDRSSLRWWDGSEWAPKSFQPPSSRLKTSTPSRTLGLAVGGAVLLVALIGAATGGFGGFLMVIGVAAMVVGIVGLVRGGLRSFALQNRRSSAIVLGVAFLILIAGRGVYHPVPSLEDASRPLTAVEESAPVDSGPTPTPSATSTRIATVEEPIPFSEVTIDDPDSDAGTSAVTTVGVDGLREITYLVTTVDGVEVSREKTGERVITAAIDQVTSVGTRAKQPVAPAPQVPAAPANPPASAGGGCHANYTPCVPIASDVDCAGGSGNGPAYVNGPVTVIGSDVYELDRDGDGIACD